MGVWGNPLAGLTLTSRSPIVTFPEQYTAIHYARDLATLRSGAAHAVEHGSPAMLLDYLQETNHPLAPIAAAAAAGGDGGFTSPTHLPEWGRRSRDDHYSSGQYYASFKHHPSGFSLRTAPEYKFALSGQHTGYTDIPLDMTYRVRVGIPAQDEVSEPGGLWADSPPETSFWASLSPGESKAALEHIRDHADTHAHTKRAVSLVLSDLALRHPELQEGR